MHIKKEYNDYKYLKIRLQYCFVVLLIVIFIGLLTACDPKYAEQSNKFRNIEKTDDYHIVSNRGVSYGQGKIYSFIPTLENKLKNQKKKLYSQQGYFNNYEYMDGKFYFSYKYFWSGESSYEDINSTYRNYVFGYFDCEKLELHILDYFDEVNVNKELYLQGVTDRYVYFCLIDKDEYRFISKKGISSTHIYDITNRVFISGEAFESKKDLIKTNYETQIPIIKQFDGREYIINKNLLSNDQCLEIIFDDTPEESIIISHNTVLDNSESLQEIIDIFERSINPNRDIGYFYSDSDLYISLSKTKGFASGLAITIPTLFFKYNFLNGTFDYIGYKDYGELVAIIKM